MNKAARTIEDIKSLEAVGLPAVEHHSTFPPYRPLGLFSLTARTEEGAGLLEAFAPGSPGDRTGVGIIRTLNRAELARLRDSIPA